MNTKQLLASFIREAYANHPKREFMAKLAEDGYYDDYDSPHVCGVTKLIEDADNAGMHFLADAARGGTFEGSREEADDWWRREGQDLVDDLVDVAAGHDRRTHGMVSHAVH